MKNESNAILENLFDPFIEQTYSIMWLSFYFHD